MRISDIKYRKYGTYNQLSARVGKQLFWYRFPPTFDADPTDASSFVCVALVPAMMFGEDLMVDDRYTISSRLFDNLASIQQIYHCWNPIFKRIKVVSNTRRVEPEGLGCASFFSAGVDATYSLLKNISEIEYMILINGFDYCMGSETGSVLITDKIRHFFRKSTPSLNFIETNN